MGVTLSVMAVSAAVIVAILFFPSVNKDDISIQTSYMTQILEASRADCIANDTTINETEVVITPQIQVSGNYTGIQSATTSDATCIMTSQMNSSIASIIEAQIQQTNTTASGIMGLLGGSTININDIDYQQSIKNNITEVSSATCSAQNIAINTSRYIYTTGQVGGDFVGIAQSSDASAACTMNNIMKAVAFNKSLTKAGQKNDTTSGMTILITFFALVVVIMAFTVIMLTILGIIGGVAGVVGTKSGKKSGTGTTGTAPYGMTGTAPYGMTGTAPYGMTGTSPYGMTGTAYGMTGMYSNTTNPSQSTSIYNNVTGMYNNATGIYDNARGIYNSALNMGLNPNMASPVYV